jgi:hypothetical protein
MPLQVITDSHQVEVPSALGDNKQITVKTRARVAEEYVTAGGFPFVMEYARALPQYIDDLTQHFGADLYARMRRDPQIESALSIFITAILTHGLQFKTPVKKDNADYDLAEEMVNFVQMNMDRLPTSIMDILYEMLLALAYGYKVAEIIYKTATYFPDKGTQLVLAAIKTKPQGAAGFVVDRHNNILGLTYRRGDGRMPDLSALVAGQAPVADDAAPAAPAAREVLYLLVPHGERRSARQQPAAPGLSRLVDQNAGLEKLPGVFGHVRPAQYRHLHGPRRRAARRV